MKMHILILFVISTQIKINAQQFINGDLDGTITSYSTLPPFWSNVPYNDITCQATSIGRDSPDLTSLSQPGQASGINGNPFSGLTFISGVYGAVSQNPPDFFQEGIMQTVSGFIPGSNYSINFHQAVVKQYDCCLDSSGSWIVFIDSTLAGITAPTFNPSFWGITNFIWELRTVIFTATETSHVIKFLPVDNDNQVDWGHEIRMGIDSININGASPLTLDSTLNSFLIIPNVFTPNSDGINDFFNITTKNIVTLYCKIYNRWGILIREVTNINEEWDGLTADGLKCTEGVYYYTLTALGKDGKGYNEKGFVQLIN